MSGCMSSDMGPQAIGDFNLVVIVAFIAGQGAPLFTVIHDSQNQERKMADKIAVNASLIVKEGKLDEIRPIVEELVRETRKEPGCIRYQCISSIENPLQLFFHEEWESSEALDKHMQSEHFQRALPAFGALLEQPPVITKCKPFVV
eukprot:GEZU01044528.1.p1 GENE.GEZU01044528.1~~GEZU01044528.1.p1  ORF type:complete len:146 (-),score=11.74 GEZU01044528.1:243-680(-)